MVEILVTGLTYTVKFSIKKYSFSLISVNWLFTFLSTWNNLAGVHF